MAQDPRAPRRWIVGGLMAAICLAAAARPAPASAQAYVANLGSGTVSIIDTTTNQVVGDPIFVDGQPYRVAVTPDGRFVYVTNVTQNKVSVIDTQLNPPQVVATIGLAGSGRGVAISGNGFAYVVGGQNLHKISTATHTQVGPPLFIQGSTSGGPEGVGVTPNGSFAYVADSGSNVQSLFVIDAASTPMTMIFPVYSFPSGAAPQPQPALIGGSIPIDVVVRPDGLFVYNTSKDQAVQVNRVSDHNYVGGCGLGMGNVPQGIAATGVGGLGDGQVIFTANASANTVSICPVNDSSGLPPVPPTHVTVGDGPANTNSPQYLSATPNGQLLYVTNRLKNAVEVINLTSTPPAKITTIPVGLNPRGIAVSPLATPPPGPPPPPPPPPPPSPPVLSVTPGSLGFAGEQGLGDPFPQSLQVANTGGGTLGWLIAAATVNGANWLSANPTSGSAPPTASPSVAAGTCGLPAGSYTGSIAVSAAGADGSPQSVPVALTVTQPGGLLPTPSARVCTDRPSYGSGQTLVLSVSLRQGASSNSGDAYLFTQVPGTTIFVSLVLSGGQLAPQFGPAPVPLATGFPVPDFAGGVFEFLFGGSEPAGTYDINAILALAGTDPNIPGNQLAVGTTSFTFAP